MAYTRKQITLDAVYKRRMHLPTNSGNPSFLVTGGTVNVYHYIKSSEGADDPANIAAMVADDANPFSAGAHPITAMADNIAWETASGTPIVTTINIVQ